jgi:phosphatidylserine/phosphatidylglycerophosphate/cardiolipin synthase-like enzyme
VVLLGLDATEEAAVGLLGFTILKKKGKAGRESALGGGKIFQGLHRESARHSTRSDKAPIQAFMWSDYVVDPGTEYTYTVIPVYGTPDAQKRGKQVRVKIKTEALDQGTHGIHFNRGVAGSQAYARRFGKYRKAYRDGPGDDDWKEFIKPEDVPDRAAYKWLSRGLEEAMLGFIGQAKGPEYALRAAVYELTYQPAIEAFVDAMERGADVKVIHHSKVKKTKRLKGRSPATVTVEHDDGTIDTFKNTQVVVDVSPDAVGAAANRAIENVGVRDPKNVPAFRDMWLVRSVPPISHNKFIILLKDGKPIQVWTGSTNYTDGGIFGQSNVGHVVRDAKVARAYHDYWTKLSTNPPSTGRKSDPPGTGLRDWTVIAQPDLVGPPPPKSITPVFSPRKTEDMLDWYAEQLAGAKSSVHFTAAFTVADQIYTEVLKKKRRLPGKPYQRYLLLESITGLMRDKSKEMAKVPQNRMAWGETLDRPDHEDELIETLTGLNSHVNYLHTKYLLIDPLTDDPVVVTGSANFSTASTKNNDENMLVIRGDTRVADVFLGEFMRLFNHFHVRNRLNRLSAAEEEASSYLAPDDSWTKPHYKKGSQEQQERILFS